MLDHPTDDIDDDLPNPERDLAALRTPRRPTSAAALAETTLDASLTRRSRAALRQTQRVIIVKTPNAAWSEMIKPALLRDKGDAVLTVTELVKLGGAYHRVGADRLELLRLGKSIIYVCHDPDTLLDEAVLASADETIVIPPLTSSLLAKVIRRVSGGTARGLTPEMAMLDLPVILAGIRQGLSARLCVDNLQRALTRQLTASAQSTPTVPLLDTLPLTAPVRDWTEKMLADLAAVRGGTLPPGQLSFGVLEGPPGCGKTLIAESLARTAGWNFVSSSVGSWFTSGDGALGDVSRNLKRFIDAMLESEPAIGFMDEIDALPDRSTMDARAREWWTTVVTLFLTEIDRLRRSGRKIMLLSATNFYHRLDAALVRPGRLQQRISVLPPQSDEELIALMRYYLGADLADADLGKLARPGRGATPAMVEGWVKEARASARAEARSLTFADLLEAIVPKDARTPGDIRTIAIHECGHALVALRLGRTVETISILPEGTSGGRVLVHLPTIVPTWQDMLDTLAVTLGGRAADIVLGRGANAGAEADLAEATQMLLDAHERQGLGKTLVAVPAKT
ncbi:MAG TPA: AAA family ATPase, partial [Devosia sp.]|nr:AAA family ATPase [Devosia sp.]